MPLAALPMYDLPEARRATDAWWQGLAHAFRHEGLREVPDRLTREPDPWAVWLDPTLLFGQTCGYPLTHGLEDHVRLVATPCYGAPGCTGPSYASLIVVRADDPAQDFADLDGRRAAVNAPDSYSGCHALRAMVARAGIRLRTAVLTGSHAGSIAAVGRGETDVCAVDAVSHALFVRHAPCALAGTRVLAVSPAAPGLPYVTSRTTDDDRLARLRAGLSAALAAPGLTDARAALLLTGAEVLSLDAYRAIANLRPAATGEPLASLDANP